MNNLWDTKSTIIYLSVFITSILFIDKIKFNSKFSENGKSNILKYKIWIALLPAFFLLALRGESVGQDLIRYKASYLSLEYKEISFSWILNYLTIREPLYLIVNILIGYFSNWNFQVLIIVLSFIQFEFLNRVLVKQKLKGINPILCLSLFLCYIYVRSFSMVRQGIALTIMLYAYTLLEEKEYKKYWIYSFIALGFHYTAIISILIYFWTRENRANLLKKILLVLACGFLLIYGEKIFPIVFQMMGNKYSKIQLNTQLGWGNLLSRIPIVILIIWKRRELRNEFTQIGIYVNIFYLDIIISQFKYLNIQFERFTMYTFMSLIFILPALYTVLKKRYGLIVNFVFVVGFIIYFIYKLYYYTYVSPYNIMPYRFFWQSVY